MNNQELELKIKELFKEENFFDFIEKAVEFEKEYKTTNFYKKTKMSLIDMIKYGKVFYSLNLSSLFERVQKYINELNTDNVMNVINQLGDIFTKENEDIQNQLNELKEFKEEM